MITDNLANMSFYKQIPAEVVHFIHNLTEDINTGRYEIADNIYASVSEYNTKYQSEAKFEAHEKYIDIQILLLCEEKIYYTDKSQLNTAVPYNSNEDIEFFAEKTDGYSYAILDGANFVMLFPHEAHAPQIACNIPQHVKKVVVKIKI